MPQYDVAQEVNYRNPVKYSSIVCSAMPNGVYTVNNQRPSGIADYIIDMGASGVHASGLYTKLNTRFDDPTYY